KTPGGAVTTTGRLVGGALFAGDVVGAALTIFSLFGPGSSPDQAILDQLSALRAQIAELRDTMVARFDQVDKEIQAVRDQVNCDFGRIDFQLGVLQDSVDAIRSDLYDRYAQAVRSDQKLASYLDDIYRQPLVIEINKCLDYRQSYRVDMSQALFAECESFFY